MKYSIFLFVALLSEIRIQPALVAGQQLYNSFEDRPFNKDYTLFSDTDDGVIIIAALRRRGSTFRGKYKKVIETTTHKIVKATTTAAFTSTTEAIKPTTEVTKPTTEATKPTTEVTKPTTEATKPTTEATKPTTEATKPTTVKVIQVTQKEVVKGTVNVTKDRRRSQLTQEQQNALWTARKRVTRPPTYVQKKQPVKVNIVEDEEDYSVRRARYLFTQRAGRK